MSIKDLRQKRPKFEVFALLEYSPASIGKYVVSNISEQPLGPVFKSEAFKKWGPTDCTETSVTNYQSGLRNIPEDKLYYYHCVGTPKSCVTIFMG